MCTLKRIWKRAWDSWLEPLCGVALILAILALFVGITLGAISLAEKAAVWIFGPETGSLVCGGILFIFLALLVLRFVYEAARGIYRAFKDCK